MGSEKTMQPRESQADKFRAAAKRIEADDDEARWAERLKRVAKAKPAAP